MTNARRTVKVDDLVIGLVLLVAGLVYTGLATRLQVGPMDRPGSGLIPVLVGILLTVFAVAVVVSSLRPRADASDAGQNALLGEPEEIRDAVSSDVGDDEEGRHHARVIGVVAVLAGFLVLLPYLGFLPGLFLTVLLVSRLMDLPVWPRGVLLAGGLALVAYLVFQEWFLVPFPGGLIGFP